MRFRVRCETEEGSITYATDLTLADNPDDVAEKAREQGYKKVVVEALPSAFNSDILHINCP